MRKALTFTCWIIYRHPRDYPDHYVVRAWSLPHAVPEPGPLQVANTLDQARELIPPGQVRLDRDPADDPVVAEVWI